MRRFPSPSRPDPPGSDLYKIAQDIKQIAEKEGIPIEIISTNGSFDNINFLGAGKVDLAILQLDVLKFVSEIMQKEAGFNVFEQAKSSSISIGKRFTSSPAMKDCSRFISSKAKKSPWARSGAAQIGDRAIRLLVGRR